MNSYLQITSYEDFENVINSLNTSYIKLLDGFTSEKSNAEKINGTDTWKGQAQEVMYSKYNELNKNYNNIEYSLDLYIKFLNKTLEDYKKLIAANSENVDAMVNKLDVNS